MHVSNSASVKRTNDSCTVSKFSVAKSGYYIDPALSSFVEEKCKKRASLINRCYCVRYVCIEQIVSCFHDFVSSTLGQSSIQIVLLGAGFDSSFWRTCSKYPFTSIRYVEVDFPDVCRRKCFLSHSAGILRDEKIIIDSPDEFVLKCDYDNNKSFLSVGCDMTKSALFQRKLENVVEPHLPTLVIGEVVFVYLKLEDRLSILQSTFNILKERDLLVFLTYEQLAMPEVDAFSKTMLSSFERQQSPLLSYFHSLQDVVSFWRNNFTDQNTAAAINCTDIFYSLKKEDRMLYCDLEPCFDEYEPFHMKCNTYFIAISAYGTAGDAFKITVTGNSMKKEKDTILKSIPLKNATDFASLETSLRCFAFSMSDAMYFPDKSAYFVLLGGFGCQQNHENSSLHRRIRAVSIFKPASGELYPVNFDENYFFDRLFGSLTALPNRKGQFFVFGGRQSPTCSVPSYGILTLKEKKDGKGFEVDFQEENLTNWKPHARFRHVACYISIEEEGFVFINGGRFVDPSVDSGSDAQTVFSDSWLFSIDTTKWRVCQAENDPFEGRHSHSAVANDRFIYVFGGLNRFEEPLADLWRLDVSKSSTILHQKIMLTPSVDGRYGHSASFCRENSQIVVVGGVCPTSVPFVTPELLVIDVKSGVVRAFTTSPDPNDGPFMFANHQSGLVVDEDGEKLVVVGGGANCFSFGTHFNSKFLKIPVNSLSFDA